MKSTVSEKGQITLPKKLRDRFGIRAGMDVEFHFDKGTITLVKVVAQDPLDKWRGQGKDSRFNTTDSYLQMIRDEDSSR